MWAVHFNKMKRRVVLGLWFEMRQVYSAWHVEAEACRAGLLIATYQGWSDVELESDCSTVVAALNGPREDCYEIGRIMEDCMEYIKFFDFIVVRHVYRKINAVVHRLATFAKGFVMDDFWFAETPSIIEVLALCPPPPRSNVVIN